MAYVLGSSDFEAFLAQRRGYLGVELGDYDANRETIDSAWDALLRRVSQDLGSPTYSGRSKDPSLTTPFDADCLHADYSRSWRVAWWDQESKLLVATLTSHDAGSIVELALEFADRVSTD